MTLRNAYEAGFVAAVELSLLSVLMGGELEAVYWAAMGVPVAMLPFRRRRRFLSPGLGALLAVGAFAMGLVIWRSRGVDAALLAGGVFLIGMLLVRLVTASSFREDLQTLLLSLLLVFTGSILHTDVSYGIVLTGYALAVVWALVTRQLAEGAVRESTREGGATLEVSMDRQDIVTPAFFGVVVAVALLLIFSTSLLFLIFPRVGFQGLGFFSRQSGSLPSHVSLQGDSSKREGSKEVVARVRGVSEGEFIKGLYLRGPVYTTLTSSGFSRSTSHWSRAGRHISPYLLEATGEPFLYEVEIAPVLEDRLPLLGTVEGAQVLHEGYGGPGGEIQVGGITLEGAIVPSEGVYSPITYQIFGTIERPAITAPDSGREMNALERERFRPYLQLPHDFEESIRTLGEKVMAGAPTLTARVDRLRRFLKTKFEYTLEQPNADQDKPVFSFLLSRRSGHCEYFAAAYALLLRSAGIPSRVVGGYQGGSWDREREAVLFRGSNAHVWVEWFSPGVGWRVDDATSVMEAAPRYLRGFSLVYERLGRWWADNVVAFGWFEQLRMMQATGTVMGRAGRQWTRWLQQGWVLWGFVALLLGAVGLRLRGSFRRRARSEEARLARELLQKIEELFGGPLPSGMTLRRTLPGVRNRLSSTQYDELLVLLDAYERVRFGKRALEEGEWKRLMQRVRALGQGA